MTKRNLELRKESSFNPFRFFTNPVFWLSLIVLQVVIILFSRFFSESASFLLVGSDYIHYLAAARLVRDGMGDLIYNIEVNYEAQRMVLGPNSPISILTFRSLPFVSLIFLPFTFFPAITSFRIFGLINILLIFLIIYLFIKYISKKNVQTLYLLVISFTFVPILETLKNGQVSIILTAILFGIYITFRKKKYLLAGLLVSLMLLKTQFIIFFPYLFILCSQRKKFLLGFVTGLVGLFLLSSAVSGFNFWLSYPKHLLETEGPEYGSRTNELFTFYALFQNLGVWQKLSALLTGAFYIFTLILFNKKQKEVGFNNSFISFVLLSIPLSIHVLLHDLTFLLLPLFVISSSLSQSLARKRILLKTFFILAVLFVLPILSLKVSPNYLLLIIFGLGLYFLYNKLPKINSV